MLGKINIIYGCTASGKSAYGVKLAKQLNGEIINADSMQIYTEIPILTAQPNDFEMNDVPHHLYGFHSVFKPYSVFQYIKDAFTVIKRTLDIGKTPILVGGTGMYIKALVEGMSHFPQISKSVGNKVDQLKTTMSNYELHQYLLKLDPLTASKLHYQDSPRIIRAIKVFLQCKQSITVLNKLPKNPIFPRSHYYITWLNPSRELIYKNINIRFLDFIGKGAINEVSQVLKFNNPQVPKAHGLPEIRDFLYGNITLNEMIKKSQQITRNYAKRQLTWARHQFQFDRIISK